MNSQPNQHQSPKGKRPFHPNQPHKVGSFPQQKIIPGDAFTVPTDSRSKKSFPFATPIQAYRRTYITPEMKVKPIVHETLRIIPLGGLEQVGLNCIAFEYEDEILIIDAGLQFPDQYQLGINFSIPDMAYMKGKKIVGVTITHGHLDHIGAIPYLIRQLGKGTPVYATPMALELIKLRQEEHNFPLSNAIEYERNKIVQIGKHFRVTPFTVDHSMPDCVGLSIETPVGRFVHTGDWKFDSKPLPFRPSTDYKLLETFGNLGVRALLSDSTNAYLFGASISESEVVGSIEEIFRESSGRIITATFSSIIDRIMLIVSVAEKFGRKVALLGRGMNNYMDIAVKRGYAQPKPGTIVDMEALNKLPDDKVVICCTGAQGERYAALMRMTTGESQDTALKSTDTVVFSSSVIPGNERAVQGLFDLIAMQGPRIRHYKESEIHAGGHARQDDTQKMISLIRPQIYIPIYGHPYMLQGNANNAYKLGYSKDRVFLGRNGQIMEFTRNHAEVTDYFVPHRLVTVDGSFVGYSKEDTLHDRYQLSSAGVITLSLAKKGNGYMIRMDEAGFPGLHSLPDLRQQIESQTLAILHGDLTKFKDLDALRKHIERKTGDLVFRLTAKEPVVIVLVH